MTNIFPGILFGAICGALILFVFPRIRFLTYMLVTVLLSVIPYLIRVS